MAPLAVVVLLLAASLGVVAGVSTTSQSAETNATILAHYPTDDGYENETLLAAEDLETVGEPEYGTASPYEIPVTLTRTGAESFTTTLVENGFTTTGVTNCEWKGSPDDPGYCLLTVVDGNVTAWHALGPALADSIESGEFEEDPRFVFSAQNETRAERIAATLADEADTADGSEHDDETDTVTAGDAPTDTTANRSDGGSTPGFTVGAAFLALVAAMAVRLGRG